MKLAQYNEKRYIREVSIQGWASISAYEFIEKLRSL